MFRVFLAVILFACIIASCAQCAQPTAVSKAEALGWIRYTVPLPKSISITQKLTLPKSDVAIVPADSTDIVCVQAVKELRELVGDNPSGSFKITLQLGGPESEPLKKLKNSDQACSVASDATGIRIVALAPRGVYYGAKTLQQLLAPKAKGANIELPLLKMTDWPDMADRGLWGSDSHQWIPWLADRKMNLVEQISNIGVDANGKSFAMLKADREPMVTEGPQRGVQPLPAVLHLDQVGQKGVFARYPNLIAVPGGRPNSICYSQPEFPDVLADWLVALKSLPHVPEVDVWMAENCREMGGCKCPECLKTDRNILELQIILKAWEKAKQKIGYFPIRVMTSEETMRSHAQMFAILPPDVKVSYYHSLLTYTCAKVPMVWKNIEDCAATGRAVTVVPNLGPEVSKCSPFTGPQFIQYRMKEFVDKKMAGLQGFATPLIKFQKFNTEATAEWSWNVNGRSPREFAYSWAVREGMRDPEKFADWSDAYNAPGWNLNGSDWPYGEIKYYPGSVSTLLKDGKLPELGYVLWDAWHAPWGEIKSVAQFDQDLRDIDKAVKIARQMTDRPEFLQESLFTKHGLGALRALWELRAIVKPTGIAPADLYKAKKYFNQYDYHLKQSIVAMNAWNDIVAPESSNDRFVKATADIIDQEIAGMQKVAAEFGIKVASP